MGLFSFIGRIFSSNARYNHELYKSGKADRSVKVETTIGWRRDPIYKQDGFTQTRGDDDNGLAEYSRIVSGDIHREWDDTDQ